VVTIKDVAREAGVSLGTASQALRGRSSVRETTRRRVVAVAARLRYRPSAVARGLVTRRTDTIGLLVSDITHSFFIRAVRTIEAIAQEHGFTVMLCNTDEDPAREAEYLRVLAERRVDGIILATSAATPTAFREVRRQAVPLVFFDRKVPGVPASSVTVDGVAGGRLAARHLLGLGHRRIAIIHGPLACAYGVGRLQGYREALHEAGVRPVPALMRQGNFKADSGYALARELLGLVRKPTALFCTNTLLTLGALQAVQERGIRIPEELSLIGYDDVEWCALMHPPLTVVAQPVHDVGQEAMRLLLEQIGSARTRRPQHVILKPELIVRDSCAPLRVGRPLAKAAGNLPPRRESSGRGASHRRRDCPWREWTERLS
jgi:LacI family transcriptional regulator